MGSIVNAICILIGGCLGIILKKGINTSIQEGIYRAIGICVIIIGINGIVSNMALIHNQHLSTSGDIILVISLVGGTLIGEWIQLDNKLTSFSMKIEKKFKVEGFATGFITASLIFCVGAMAIIGAINDGLLHDPNVLYVKSVIDGITSIILASTLGVGVIFSCIPVFIYQGLITLLASALSSILIGEFLRQLCMVGYALVMTIGFNFLLPTKIKVANMLPSLLVVICINVVLMII